MLKKKFLVVAVSAAVALGGVAVVEPGVAQAQGLTMAEIYEPRTKGASFEVSVTERLLPITVDGSYSLSEVSQVQLFDFESPYPIDLVDRSLNPVVPMVWGNLKNERIYPKTFDVPYKARVTYIDGSEDVVSGKLNIHVTPGLVKEEPKTSTPDQNSNPSDTVDEGSSTGAIIGAVVGVLALLGLLGAGAAAAGLIPGVQLPL